MNFKVIKILAVGCNKRFMWISNGEHDAFCVRISDALYTYLKMCGVPTSQSLRFKKDKNG